MLAGFNFGQDGALIGNGGWKGPPADSAAELGYAVAPARQGRGVATAVVHELVTRARAAGLHMVFAHTLAAESASTSVLARCGFTRVAELIDPDEGPVWRWELRLNASRSSNTSRGALAVTNPDRTVRVAQSITDERWKASALARVAKAVAGTDPDRASRLIADAERIARSITKAEGWADVALASIVNVLVGPAGDY